MYLARQGESLELDDGRVDHPDGGRVEVALAEPLEAILHELGHL